MLLKDSVRYEDKWHNEDFKLKNIIQSKIDNLSKIQTMLGHKQKYKFIDFRLKIEKCLNLYIVVY